MEITLLKKGMYRLKTDNGELLIDEAGLAEDPIYVGKEIGLKQWNSLSHRAKIFPLLKYGEMALAKRNYSEYEIRNKIKNKFPNSEDVNEVVFILKQEGFIDDKRFAYEYAEIKEASLYGRGRISDDLEFVYHVSKEIISSISWSDDEEASKQVARALDRKYSSFPYIKKKAKAKLFLEKRGFLPSSISLALEEIKEDKEKTDKKLYLDATNAYRRLKLRYNGYELRQRLFASLLRKGYDSGSLAKALEEISNEDDI